MSKSEIRDLLIELKPFVKLNFFAKACGISSSSLSLFMRDSSYNYTISQERLDDMVDLILSTMSNFA